jgi:CelD/BcsL family acetyltransferase involved in cellulose biosynthesis
VKLIAYDQSSAFNELQPEWNELLHRSNCDQIFSTWEWQSTWWSAYEAGDLWVVAVRDDDNRLVGIAPWFVEHKPDGERIVRTVGCVDVTDYVDLICDPQYTRQVYALLAEHLEEQRERYDRINLCNIPEESPTRTEFASTLESLGFEVEIEMQEVCPVIPLPRTFEDYLGRLDKKQRHEIRRKIRRAETEPTLNWYIVGPEHNIQDELEKFLQLMAASHETKAEFLQDPKNQAFFRSIVPLAFERGWLQLAFLCVEDQPAATYLNFDYDARVLVYNSGLAPEAYGHLSAGIVLLAYLIEHAIETDRHVFDFLRGNETYKYRMGAVDTRVYKLKARLKDAA